MNSCYRLIYKANGKLKSDNGDVSITRIVVYRINALSYFASLFWSSEFCIGICVLFWNITFWSLIRHRMGKEMGIFILCPSFCFQLIGGPIFHLNSLLCAFLNSFLDQIEDFGIWDFSNSGLTPSVSVKVIEVGIEKWDLMIVFFFAIGDKKGPFWLIPVKKTRLDSKALQ